MRKERIFNLETESRVKEFVEKINDDFYYIDFDNECWKGDELRESIQYENNYDAFIGSYKEVEPYEFFYVEQESAFLKYSRTGVSFDYNGDSFEVDICETEKVALDTMKAQWDHLTSREKDRKTVFAYSYYSVPEYIGKSSAAKIVGFATKYRNHEYISDRDFDFYIIDKIDDDISGDVSAAYIVFDGVNYFYEKEIDGVYFRVEVSREEWELWQDIYLEKRVEIFA